MPPDTVPGSVYTFYSYKGGVGRSMTLANVAALLARAAHKVLVVDWDLEAPGLEKYFQASPESVKTTPGLIDWIESVDSGTPLAWKDCLLTAIPFTEGVPVSIFHAGKDDGGYMKRVQKLSWKQLFTERDFGERLEEMRCQWIREFEFVLVDSRTGLSDMGGICTIHLPDALMVFFTANEQSMSGVKTVVEASRAVRGDLPFDRNPHFYCVPVPSRWESLTEHEISKKWQQRFVAELGKYFREWLEPDKDVAQTVADMSIPYKAYWSFGEQLPVLERTWEPTDPAAFYQKLADGIASGRWSGAPVLKVSPEPEIILEPASSRTQLQATIELLSMQENQTPLKRSILADAYGMLGDLQIRDGDFSGTEQSYRAELRLREALPATEPLEMRKLFSSYIRVFEILSRHERWEEALQVSKQQEAAAEKLGSEKDLWRARGRQALALFRLSRSDEGLAVLRMMEQNPDETAVVAALTGQSGILQSLGRADDALVVLERLQLLGSTKSNKEILALAYNNQAIALMDLARYEEALEAIHRAQQIRLELDDKPGLANLYADQAAILRNMARFEEALPLLVKQEAISMELGDLVDVQASYANQAAILIAMGRPREALEILKNQASLCRQLNLRRYLAECLFTMANVHLTLDHILDARKNAMEALAIFRELGAVADEIERVQQFIRLAASKAVNLG